MGKIFNLNFLRIMALIAMLVGAIGSLGFMFYAGRNQNSVILIALFTTWVLSPFVGLLIADKISKRWTVNTSVTLYWLMIVLSLGSLIIYSGALIPLGTKPAFKFLVVPFISWLLILTVIPIVSRLTYKHNDISSKVI
jgi:hypothetical protein